MTTSLGFGFGLDWLVQLVLVTVGVGLAFSFGSLILGNFGWFLVCPDERDLWEDSLLPAPPYKLLSHSQKA